MADIIQLRRDTAANWTTNDPTLADGEQGLETDTTKIKYGNGTDNWNALAYLTVEASSLAWGAITGTLADQTDLDTELDAKQDNLTLNAKTGSYTVVIADAGKYIRVNAASANNVTVNTGLNALATGTQINVRQAGSGQTTIVASGTTINTAETLKLNKQHSTCTLIKVGTSEWDLLGDMEVSA